VTALLPSLASPARARNPEQPETAAPLGNDQTFIDHTTFAPFWFGGFGLNAIQQLGGMARVFARGGWNDGRHESFTCTEAARGGLRQLRTREHRRAGYNQDRGPAWVFSLRGHLEF
jgi:hypothetical protein